MFCFFSASVPSVPWGLFKSIWYFFVWFLVGKDRGSVVIPMRKREEADVLRNRTVLKRPYQEGARAHKHAEMETTDDTAIT